MTLVSLSKTVGPTTGGDEITLSGSGFILDEGDTIVQLSTGGDYTLALSAAGVVFAWGDNSMGQLGTGDATNYNIPHNITAQFGSEKVTQVSSGYYASFALTTSGKVFAWGGNNYGQLGTGDTVQYDTPQDISAQFGPEVVTQVSGGSTHSLAMTASGKVFSWGTNSNGELGTGDSTNYYAPVDITAQFGSEEIVQVLCGPFHSIALSASGEVFTWGLNWFGQLGTGDNVNYDTPQNITPQFGSETVAQVATKGSYSLVLTASGKVFSWGGNNYGQLGTGNNTNYNSPQDITAQFGTESVTELFAGYSSSFAFTASGIILAWGNNSLGQLGTGDMTNYNSPQDITAQFGSEVIVQIVSGDIHSAAVANSDKVFTWGSNVSGQSGTGSATYYYTTVQDVTANFALTVAPIVQVASIYFGSSRVVSFDVVDENTVRLTVPPHAAGVVDVIINGIHGEVTVLALGYTYVAPDVPNTGSQSE